jgi:hypothetical protein
MKEEICVITAGTGKGGHERNREEKQRVTEDELLKKITERRIKAVRI